MRPPSALHSVCLLTVVPKCSYMGKTWNMNFTLLRNRFIFIDAPRPSSFLFLKRSALYCWEQMASEEKVEGVQKGGQSWAGGCNESWVTMLNLDAVFIGCCWGVERNSQEATDAGRRLSGQRKAHLGSLHLSRAVFVLSASLQCCLVAFRSSSIVQGYERTKNGLPLGRSI